MQAIKPIDLSKILKPHENKWVALSSDYKKVLAAGKTLKETKLQADKKGSKYLFVKLPPFDAAYVPSSV